MCVCSPMSARGRTMPNGTSAASRGWCNRSSRGMPPPVIRMSDTLLEVNNLRVHFGAVPALQDVSFDLLQGETLGLVGESGSGKSTLARAILRLIPASSGSVLFQGENLLSLGNADLRRR